MKTLIIVSKCLRVTKINSSESSFEFHFRGVFGGEILRRVYLQGGHDLGVYRGVEYLMYVQLVSIDHGILRGRIIKLRPLMECMDRS
jgi:hypothetical protein